MNLKFELEVDCNSDTNSSSPHEAASRRDQHIGYNNPTTVAFLSDLMLIPLIRNQIMMAVMLQ